MWTAPILELRGAKDIKRGQIKFDLICGTDFCDGCGDCLHCYGDDWCPEGIHHPIVYLDQLDKFLEQHEGHEVHVTWYPPELKDLT